MSTGISALRVDAAAKVSGRARYTEDLGLPGMLHAALVRAPIAHGLVKSIDAKAALALSGVLAVFTYKDVPQTPYATAGHPYNLEAAKRDVADRLILTGRVRQFGDEVAVVVARDYLTAAKAAHLVKVEYEELPVMLDRDSALGEGAVPIHENLKTNLLRHHVSETGGKMDEILAASPVVVEGRYKTPIIQHCHMEGVVSYAYMEAEGRVTIVSSTQIPHIVRRIVGQALGLPWSKIRVIKPYLGGGFGNKQDILVEPLAAFLTLKMGGAPVQVSLTREEIFIGSRTRHRFDGELKIGLKKDGTITGLDVKVFSSTGAYASHGHSIAGAAGSKSPYLYPRAAFRYEASTYYSNAPTAGAMRGYGQPQVTFFMDCLVEEAAEALKMDPLALRLKNVARVGDVCHYNGHAIESAAIYECLEKGAAQIGWDKKWKEYQKPQKGEKRRGIGVACFSYGSNTFPSSVEVSGCRMSLNQDGRVTMSCGATEIGQGIDTSLAQMAAEALNMPLDNIEVVSTHDTDLTPFDTGAYASRQAYTSAPAIVEAARLLTDEILDLVQLLTGVSRGGLKISGTGIVGSDGRTVIMSLKDLAEQSFYNMELGHPISSQAAHKTRLNPPVFGCTFVEVEVDVPLCRVDILNYLNVHDSGRVINPQIASGQVHGGMGMGLGWALYEEMLLDDKGRVLNNNLLDYKFPTFMDVPDLDCLFIEAADAKSPFGHKALGEPPIVSPAPAIRNAVWQATGVKVDEIPITPKTLFKYLAQAGL